MKPERGKISIRVTGKPPTRRGWLCALAGVGLLVLAAGVGLLGARAQQGSFSLPAIDPPGATARTAPAGGNQDGRAAMPADLQTAPKAGDPQTQEVTRECAQLLKMATDLKTEVDKTTQNTLSVTVVRKADAIEELARKVKTGSGKN